jgi:hypothetical protein
MTQEIKTFIWMVAAAVRSADEEASRFTTACSMSLRNR